MLETKSQAALSLQDQGALYPVGMQFKDRLKSARKDAGRTQAQIAAEMGVTPQAVSGWERGEAMPEPEKIPALARFLKKSTGWMMDDDGLMGSGDEFHIRSEDVAASLDRPPKPMVKIKGYVGAGSEAHYYALADEDYEEVPAPVGATSQTVAVEIKGASFGPLMNTWLVFYDDVRSPVTSDLIGSVCVIGLSDDRILIKQIKRERNGSYTLLSNANEEPIHNAQIEWAAKVTDMRPR